jgi:glycosyltransferase involved in cell wall biosynthesis
LQQEKKIRILLGIRQGQIGGGESHLLSLVENLNRNFFDPVVLSFTDGPMVQILRKMNVPVFLIHTLKPFDISVWGRVRKLLREQSIDMVHAHGTRAASNLIWATRNLSLPLIYTIHGWSFHDDQHFLVRKLRIWGEKYLTRKASINISVSSSNQQTGKKEIRSFDSVVINNGIDLEKFNPSNSFPDVRNELGIDKEKRLILFLARFTAHKQPLTLLKVFSRICRQNPSMHLLMVGEGDQLPEAYKYIDVNQLQEYVTMCPFRQDVPAVLAATDIYVLPSLWEGLPIGLLEAMAMQKAVIVSDVDGTREIVRNRENGIMIPVSEMDIKLGDSLIELLTHRQLCEQYAVAARQTIVQKFSAEHMTRQIEEIYFQLTDNK